MNRQEITRAIEEVGFRIVQVSNLIEVLSEDGRGVSDELRELRELESIHESLVKELKQ